MATASEITVPETLHCPICLKKFNTPRILPCLHTFCEECLTVHIQTHVQGGSQFMCPNCKAMAHPTDFNILAVNKWASAFPINEMIINIMEVSDNIGETGEHCEPCKTVEETNNAEFWCIDCQEKLCSSCKRSHTGMKMSRHHKLVPLDEKEQHKQQRLPQTFDQDCIIHHGKKLEVFCVEHRELCCLPCFTNNHRECNDIRDIDEVTRDHSRRVCYSNIITDITKIKQEMETVLVDKTRVAQLLTQEKEQVQKDMDAAVDRVIARLNELRTSFKNETDQLFKSKKDSVSKNDSHIQSFITDISNCCKILENIENNGSPRQKFVTFERIRSQIMSHYEKLKSDVKDDAEVHLSLKPNKALQDMEASMDSLGTVNVSTNPNKALDDGLKNVDGVINHLNSCAKMSTATYAAQVEKHDLMTSSVVFIKNITREQLGNGTFFIGGTFLSDGSLLMSDYKSNRLVRLDNNYNIIKEYNVDYDVTDVTTGSNDNEIYLAVGNKSIYRCTLDTNLIVQDKIAVEGSLWGVAVIDDKIIAGTVTSVTVLTKDGKTVKSTATAGGNCYVTVQKRQNTCTMYYRDGNAVVCREMNGKILFRYQNNKLNCPIGNCLDKQSNLYVCGLNSKNVHQISSDGQRSRILLNKLHDISDPWTVIVHPHRNELIVISHGEHTVFEVYRLS